MESQDPLSELADIHLPSIISFWPPAIGWWILAALILLAGAYLYRANTIRLGRHKHLHYALNELDNAYQNYAKLALLANRHNQAGLDYLNKVNAILRRVALIRCTQPAGQQQSLAKLNGTQWLNFLDSCDANSSFSKGPGKALADGIYQRTFDTDGDALYQLAQEWIKNRYRTNLKPSEGTPA